MFDVGVVWISHSAEVCLQQLHGDPGCRAWARGRHARRGRGGGTTGQRGFKANPSHAPSLLAPDEVHPQESHTYSSTIQSSSLKHHANCVQQVDEVHLPVYSSSGCLLNTYLQTKACCRLDIKRAAALSSRNLKEASSRYRLQALQGGLQKRLLNEGCGRHVCGLLQQRAC
jgi:hypothetical protein